MPSHDLVWKGDLRFSLANQRVVRTDASAETDLGLTPNEFRILYLLASNEGAVFGREEILRRVWGESLHVVERTIDKHICSLRRKLGAASRCLRSIPGAGYCFSSKRPVRLDANSEVDRKADHVAGSLQP